jgi:hypothetical protein
MAETLRRTRVEIPSATIFKLVTAAALVWLWLTLAQLVLVVIVAPMRWLSSSFRVFPSPRSTSS